MKLASFIISFLRRRVYVSYWFILLVIILEWLARLKTRQVDIRLISRVRLAALQSSYDAKRDEGEWGLQLGDYSLDSYTSDLNKAWSVIFGRSYVPSRRPTVLNWPASSPSSVRPEEHPIPWESLEQRLALDANPDFKSTIPHRVYTTSATKPEDYPSQFGYWAENDPGLSFRHLNDTTMDEYLNAIYPPASPMSKVLQSLPMPVLKADILRYTVLLHKGGIYSDIDTAAVRKFDDWGQGAGDMTDQIIAHVPRMLKGDNSLSQALPPPSLIVSIEMSHDSQWREKTMARGLQLVQWTIAAQPGHPVFLDVLSHVVTKWESGKYKNIVNGRLSQDEVLDWTGPGPWSDAVIRYILARHGINPRSYAGINAPVRIGDILLLPARSFQADASEGPQLEHVCVWHGFLGSWKSKDET